MDRTLDPFHGELTVASKLLWSCSRGASYQVRESIQSEASEGRASLRQSRYLPVPYRDALVAAGQAQPHGIPALPEWNEALALDAMDKLSVRLAILSISSPGVHFGDDAAAVALARAVNETGAQISAAAPQRV